MIISTLSSYNGAWKVFEAKDIVIPVIWKFQSLHQENKQQQKQELLLLLSSLFSTKKILVPDSIGT